MSVKMTTLHGTKPAQELIRITEGDLDQELAAYDILRLAEALRERLQKLAPAARAEAKRLLADL